jgi:hypothetical protein
VVRTMATRTRNRTLAKRVASVDPEAARHLIADALPDDVASVTGPDEIEGMRGRLLALRPEERPLLRPRDFAEALGVFLWVVAATFPVAVPFLLTDDVALAMRASQATTLAMLFLAGLGLGRYAGHPKPFRTGTFAAAFGAVLIAAVKFSGGDEVTWSAAPIVGGLFGATRGVVPGLEATVAWESLDFYIEAEYVHDLDDASASYFYAWSEIGWTPIQWLRVGVAGQRTHTVDNGRDLQRGVFAQFIVGKATLGIYAFNPDSGARYLIAAFGLRF